MFLFLAATVVAVFAFASVALWVKAQSAERRARDRFALLKAVAEQPGENATRVIEFLREQDEKQAERQEREKRRGDLVGGLSTAAAGIGIIIMLLTVGGKAWGVGLIPLLVGAVVTASGLLRRGAGTGKG
jgi:hypothetical protein